jgi:hypothetical protein
MGCVLPPEPLLYHSGDVVEFVNGPEAIVVRVYSSIERIYVVRYFDDLGQDHIAHAHEHELRRLNKLEADQ